MPRIKRSKQVDIPSKNDVVKLVAETLELGNCELEKQDVIDSGDFMTSSDVRGINTAVTIAIVKMKLNTFCDNPKLRSKLGMTLPLYWT